MLRTNKFLVLTTLSVSFVLVLVYLSLLSRIFDSSLLLPIRLSEVSLLLPPANDNAALPPPRHIIPNSLLFTYSSNLLTMNVSDNVLKNNVLKTIDMYQSADVRFLTDQDCLLLLQDYYQDDAAFMRQHYIGEKGMIKGDICRGLALYKDGGLYMDVDLHCRTSVWPLIHVNTTFVTVVEFDGSKNFFQAFIAVTPRHAIIKRYLDLFLKHYKGELKTKKKDKVNFKKGTVLLRIAHRQVIAEQPDLVSSIQLWTEIKYNPIKFAHIEKPPGRRFMCQFLVFDAQLNVPFWSHVPGSSRLCRV